MTPIPLETPLKRGETEITEILLRKPTAGELRGLSLVQLMNGDAGSVMVVLPRISTPTLTDAEVRGLDVADLSACALEIAAFLLPKSTRQAMDSLTSPAASPIE